MSLADQGQQWFPTSVQVTVHQARNLRAKGKNGTNDAYAIFQVAKDKFSTSVAEKSVTPVWKEEASFDLPLFHPSNADRCTLTVTIMHRAQVGLDKLLGQAVVDLLSLHDNKSRKKSDWFKLVGKSGKEDKPRGEVLLDVQFMRNNMSASMFDLSMQDKPRSKLSKLKDKVRGKKKHAFSDSASAIVPSVSQVLTDSEPEADAQSLDQSPGVKKKSKLKKLFGPKSNLERNISKSMSTLGALPEKNSSLSSSRSSGLNVDSPEVKHKFKFLGHKRTGSSDSKVSQGPFSLLGRSKQSNSDANSLCINGSHVYAEEAESKSGSSLSLNSSGQGSVEDVRKLTSTADRSMAVPSIQIEADRGMVEQQRHQEEEERRQAEERRMSEAKRLEEEEKYRTQTKRLQEEEERRYQEGEQERRRRALVEDEARRKSQREEEERKKEERRMVEAAESQRLEEERRKAEEQKRQEETSMSDRLTSLFGMIRKKEERKEEEAHKRSKEAAPHPEPRDPDQPISHSTSNPFEEIPLNPDPPVGPPQKPSRNPQAPSAMVFLNRTAKVSAVRPRLAKSLESEPTDCQTPSQPCPSPSTSESTLSSVPSESPGTFSALHHSLAPPELSGSPQGSTENLSFTGSTPVMAEKKKRAPQPPSHLVHGTQNGGNHISVKEINNPAYVEEHALQQGKKMSLPLPDYESLFPQKRHGVQGQTRWDHIIAEVNQKHRDSPPEFVVREMSVDGPEEYIPSLRPSLENPAVRHNQTHNQKSKPVSSKTAPPPLPPKAAAPTNPRSADSSQRHSQNTDPQPPMSSTPITLPGPANAGASSRESLSLRSRNGKTKVLPPTPSPRPVSQSHSGTAMPDDERSVQVTVNQEAPKAVPRQRVTVKEPVEQVSSAAPVMSDKHINNNIQTSSSRTSSTESKGRQIQDDFAELDPFPSTDLLFRDPWAEVAQNQEVDDLFTGSVLKTELKLEDRGMTTEDLDSIFNQDKPTDPFADLNGADSIRHSEYGGKDKVSTQVGPAVRERNSPRQDQSLPSPAQSNMKMFQSQLETIDEMPPAADKQSVSQRDATNESKPPKPRADLKTQSRLYGGEDPFGAEQFTAVSALAPSEPLQVVAEEPKPQTGNLSGGKPLRARVSPETQQVAGQNSNGGGLSFTPRRPHPVKPMNSGESQHPVGYPAVKEIRVHDGTAGKIQVADAVESGPYTQLTQEELITLVVKQQTDMSRKDAKIVELEEYIDNLLVRVIDEKPSILNSLNPPKPV